MTEQVKTFGSLFAGVGGFDIGLERAGWECQWQVEWDKHCQEVLKRHWPDTQKYLDVQDVDGAKIKPVDLITFGSPCQDLSVAGKGAGLHGERSGMFFEAIRIIKEMRSETNGEYPKWAIWENVPGEECLSSLVSVLQPLKDVDHKFYLSPKTAAGILRRAERKGNNLPPMLKIALENLSSMVNQDMQNGQKAE